MSVSDWVGELREALDAEFVDEVPRVVTLATVDDEGRPRARSVICRNVEDDGSLWVASDARSEKNHQARAHPFGAMVFWLPSLREQFCLAGSLSVTSASERRDRAWAELSDKSRALFFGAKPGSAIREGDEFPEEVGAWTAIPGSFELLILKPDCVDHVDLNEHPARRRIWRADRSWAVRDVNP
jgi:PPOX class probable FMN-dependent enzyme